MPDMPNISPAYGSPSGVQYARQVGLYDPIDSQAVQWNAGMQGRETGQAMMNWHNHLAAQEAARAQQAAAQRAYYQNLERQQFEQMMAERRDMQAAFQAEERRKQQLHARDMKKTGAHDLYRDTAKINAANAPAMAAAQSLQGIANNAYQSPYQNPNVNLYDNAGNRIGGSFSPFSKSLLS